MAASVVQTLQKRSELGGATPGSASACQARGTSENRSWATIGPMGLARQGRSGCGSTKLLHRLEGLNYGSGHKHAAEVRSARRLNSVATQVCYVRRRGCMLVLWGRVFTTEVATRILPLAFVHMPPPKVQTAQMGPTLPFWRPRPPRLLTHEPAEHAPPGAFAGPQAPGWGGQAAQPAHAYAVRFSLPEYRARLERIYAVHKPENIQNIDYLLQKYTGQEDAPRRISATLTGRGVRRESSLWGWPALRETGRFFVKSRGSLHMCLTGRICLTWQRNRCIKAARLSASGGPSMGVPSLAHRGWGAIRGGVTGCNIWGVKHDSLVPARSMQLPRGYQLHIPATLLRMPAHIGVGAGGCGGGGEEARWHRREHP